MSETEKVEKKKEKKVLTPERLEQLARARKKALEIRQAGAVIKEEQKQLADAALEEKLERERQLNEAVKASLLKNDINNENLHPVPRYTNNIVPNIQPLGKVEPNERVFNYEEEEEEQPYGGRPIRDNTEASARRQPRKKPPKAKIIIEQSSDDEDEFQSNDHVIFVKRKSKNDSIKKVVPATTPVPPNTPEQGSAPRAQSGGVLPFEYQIQPPLQMTNFVDMYANGDFINRRKYY
jgi:DNA polymerase sigma